MGKSAIPKLQCTSVRVYMGADLEKGVKEKGVRMLMAHGSWEKDFNSHGQIHDSTIAVYKWTGVHGCRLGKRSKGKGSKNADGSWLMGKGF